MVRIQTNFILCEQKNQVYAFQIQIFQRSLVWPVRRTTQLRYRINCPRKTFIHRLTNFYHVVLSKVVLIVVDDISASLESEYHSYMCVSLQGYCLHETLKPFQFSQKEKRTQFCFMSHQENRQINTRKLGFVGHTTNWITISKFRFIEWHHLVWKFPRVNNFTLSFNKTLYVTILYSRGELHMKVY